MHGASRTGNIAAIRALFRWIVSDLTCRYIDPNFLKTLDLQRGDSGTSAKLEIPKKLLISGIVLNPRNKQKLTPLHVSCINNNIDIVQLLLGEGAYPECKNKLRQTPLTHAAAVNNYKLAHTLLHYGANPNTPDNDKNTPLHVACVNGSDEIAILMLDYGGDLNLRNKNNKTPLSIAKLAKKTTRKNSQFFHLLKEREERDFKWCESRRRLELGEIMRQNAKQEQDEKEKARREHAAAESKLRADLARKMAESEMQHQQQLERIEHEYIYKMQVVAKEKEINLKYQAERAEELKKITSVEISKAQDVAGAAKEELTSLKSEIDVLKEALNDQKRQMQELLQQQQQLLLHQANASSTTAPGVTQSVVASTNLNLAGTVSSVHAHN